MGKIKKAIFGGRKNTTTENLETFNLEKSSCVTHSVSDHQNFEFTEDNNSSFDENDKLKVNDGFVGTQFLEPLEQKLETAYPKNDTEAVVKERA